MNEIIRGYKVFNPDWTCRGFQYTCPGIFEEDVDLKVCERGFHFCLNLADCFNYYSFDPQNKVAEIICLGDIAKEGNKCCTNKIEIVRELTWEEVLRLVNTGKGCSGCGNSGDWNSGNFNSGSWNSGDWNSGSCNSGNLNSGSWNSGNSNSGHHNSGNFNSGDFNNGDWNKTNFSNGCFNTKSSKIYLFNKPSNWTYWDWKRSDARELLYQMPSDAFEYILFSNMTDEEKEQYLKAEVTDGYLKQVNNSEYRQIWWDKLSQYEQNIILSLPNFDSEIFEQITGIKVKK